MKLAVVGSQGFRDWFKLDKVLAKINSTKTITLIISGGAFGADRLAEQWAKDHNIETLIFKPDWNKYGKRAGIIRNADIINNSDAVVAFWDEKSPGTKNSIDRANKLNKPLLIVRYLK
jgi:hypothetical protein